MYENNYMGLAGSSKGCEGPLGKACLPAPGGLLGFLAWRSPPPASAFISTLEEEMATHTTILA